MRMPATIAALQQGRVVRIARLVRLDFKSGSMFLHQGAGPLRTADGQVWEGLGKFGSISEIDRSALLQGAAPTLTLSGVDLALIPKALASSSEVKGRPYVVFDQHFDEDWSLLDAPRALSLALMDRMPITDDGVTATITVEGVSLLHRRRRPAFGLLNDASQQRLYPGDLGAKEIPALVNRVRYWPNY